MAVNNQNTGVKRDLSLAERILEYQETLDRTAHESETTERTRLLWKHHGDTSASNPSANEQLVRSTDVEAGREQDDARSNWLVKTIQFLLELKVYAIMLSGFLPLLPFYILMAFLVVFVK
jgi:hypothetical protein